MEPRLPALADLRCPLCFAADWIARDTRGECSHCRLTVADAAVLAIAAGEIATRLEQGLTVARPDDRWTLDPLGWRNAAWRFGYTLAGGKARPAQPTAHGVALAIITRPAEAEGAIALVRSVGDHFVRRLLMIDGTPTDAAPVARALPTAIVRAHPLAGDFAAQRNRLQALAGTGWVLQLDSDERPDAALLDAIGWLVAAATADSLHSLGLPRRNLVDGRWSAQYPDIQYRLNHADVRFANRVHERPVVPFERTSLALAGAIEHRLDRARVVARTRLYETMETGAGRPQDQDRLLRPFDAIADR